MGAGSYVLQTGGRLAPSLVDANTVRFATGDMIVQGRHIGLTAPEDVKVASGTQGKKRTDYICVHYKRDVSGTNPTLVETAEWTVLQGTPGTDATAPSVPAGSILAGDADVTVPICSVSFDGLTTGEPKLLIGELTPLATLGDSVSQYTTKTFTASRNNVKVGNEVAISQSVALEGYRPLAVVSVTTNHTGSCPIMSFTLVGDNLTVIAANHEFTNKGTWPTVIYVKVLP